jgi:hypothetical protein
MEAERAVASAVLRPYDRSFGTFSLTLHGKSFVILSAGFAWPYPSPEGIHMIKLRKFLSNFGEDALLVSGLMVVFLGLYLLLAYLIIRF